MERTNHFKKILILTDFSSAAWNAVQLGLDLCDSISAKLTLLHVYSSQESVKNQPKNLEDLRMIDHIQSQVENLCKSLKTERNISIKPEILEGNVFKEIMNYILKNNFDLLIVGVNSHGLDNSLGSNSSKIISSSKLPVLVAPNTYRTDLKAMSSLIE